MYVTKEKDEAKAVDNIEDKVSENVQESASEKTDVESPRSPKSSA